MIDLVGRLSLAACLALLIAGCQGGSLGSSFAPHFSANPPPAPAPAAEAPAAEAPHEPAAQAGDQSAAPGDQRQTGPVATKTEVAPDGTEWEVLTEPAQAPPAG